MRTWSPMTPEMPVVATRTFQNPSSHTTLFGTLAGEMYQM
jgi:hypothetical protein